MLCCCRSGTCRLTLLLTLTFCFLCFWPRPLGLRAEPPSKTPAASDGAAEKKHTNALIREKSPYLLQHAHNPVKWLPWSEAAFEKAKKENKLIFLSIGYSTCHWCHVMEKECFEDEQVAALLNRDFVCIKVDREERPDVDDVYMSIAQGLGSGNGWPLTVVMTPDRRPFFAGTYIPKHDKYGIMGLMTRLPVLVRQVRYGSNLLDEAVARAQRRIELLNRPGSGTGGYRIEQAQLAGVFHGLMAGHDPVFGGFGISLKFPQPHQLLYLLSYHERTGDKSALAAVKLTLDRIRAGGVYDQLGYGIHRYAVDRMWKVPHFEKMLYDQAQLAMAAAECYRATGETKYRRMTEELFAYVLGDLSSPEGGFYSAEDADSEGEEGKFYLWTADELKRVLSDEQFAAFSKVYDVRPQGNWIDRATGEPQSTNILFMTDSGATTFAEAPDELKRHLDAAHVKLLAQRAKRIRPQRDDKIMADWNGLMIASLARGGRLLEQRRYVDAAAKAFEFIQTHLRSERGRLLHRWCRGSAGVPAYLDDHAFLAWGAIELYKATYDPKYLKAAARLAKEMNGRFWDDSEGGYFFTAADAERLPIRPKKFADMAVPSGNSVATLVLSELGRLTGEPKFEDRADTLERLLSSGVLRMPSRATQFAVALEYRRRPGVEVVVVGDAGSAETERMLSLLQKHAATGNIAILLKDVKDTTGLLAEVAPFTRNYRQIGGTATAYVCRNRTCQAPTNDPEVMLRHVNAAASDAPRLPE